MKIVTIITSLLILAVGVWLSFGLICKNANEAAEQNATQLIFLIDEYYQTNGFYPETITLLLTEDIGSRKKIFGVISVPEIRYEFESEKTGYKLFYHEFPIGPFHVYSKKETKWHYEE